MKQFLRNLLFVFILIVTCSKAWSQTTPNVPLRAVVISDMDGDGDITDFYGAGATESALEGFEVRVYDMSDNLLNSFTTADQGSGSPQIRGELGSYAVGTQLKICVVPQAGWNNTLPSTLDGSLGLPCTITTVGEFPSITYNFLLRPPVALRAVVISDDDGDGDVTDFFGPGGTESALEGFEVRVYDMSDNLLDSFTTADQGSGSPQIRAELGSYAVGTQLKICVVPQAGWNNTLPSTLDGSLGLPCTITTVGNFTGPVTYNFLVRPPVALRAIVISDTDGDGDITDFYGAGATESALEGFEVRVYDMSDNLLNSFTTADQGSGSPQIRGELGSYAVGTQLKICVVPQAGWNNTLPSTLDGSLGLPCTITTVGNFTGPVTYNFLLRPPVALRRL